MTDKPIQKSPPTTDGTIGATVEFCGIVRGEENGEKIVAIVYEAYAEMAKKMMRSIVERLGEKYHCHSVQIIHRIGTIPVGETAIYIRAQSMHRAESFGLVTEFLDQLKKDVPIWKSRIIKNLNFKNNECPIHSS
ncbi:MAG: molybdopterin synthase catalytic subunit [Verrucomicrobiia bacterium]